jgi:hypothetical protein
MDASTELVDLSRWMKLEPPDVMAQIMSLDLTNAASRVAFSEDNSSNAHITSMLFEEQVRGEAGDSKAAKSETQLTSPPQDNVEDQPIKAPTPSNNKKMKAVSIANVLNVHKALKSGAEVVVGDDVWVSRACFSLLQSRHKLFCVWMEHSNLIPISLLRNLALNTGHLQQKDLQIQTIRRYQKEHQHQHQII